MSDYFQNEIWDTGGDGRITITGDIYSTADPLSIYVGATPVKSVEFFDGGVNVIGELQIDGVPFTGGGTTTEDLIPGIFGENSAPGTFSFQNGLNIDGAVDIINDGFYIHTLDDNHYLDFTIDDVGTSTSSTLGLGSFGTFLEVSSDHNSVTPANSRNYFASTGNLEINSSEELNIVTNDSQSLKINGEIVPSLEFTETLAGTNFSIDWYAGSVQKATINASLTISFTNPIAGRTYVLIIEQGTGGSRVPTLTGWNFGDNAPTWSTTVGAKDVVTAVYDGTEYLAAFAVQNA
jgi:hypothetical protein